ncbi:MAG: hypothetical protein JJU06_10900 [Ectothiorhodospiraceae bacterium]|nr:hypothetical protein [Ectothiorhodospiraceae bacterium]MCH8505309.1 hypothetical protein [Ectothiorhodospiraceae bacterium]
MQSIRLRDLDKDALLELRQQVEQEIENRRFEERLRWEAKRAARSRPGGVVDGSAF